MPFGNWLFPGQIGDPFRSLARTVPSKAKNRPGKKQSQMVLSDGIIGAVVGQKKIAQGP